MRNAVIEFEWGNLSAFEMIHRFWSVMARGGYCTHGETFYNDAHILWWSKGGRLQGESVRRISFLKELMEQLSGYPRVVMDTVNTDPNGNECHSEDPFTSGLMKLSDEEIMEWMAENLPMLFGNDDYRIRYFGRSCPGWFMAEPLDGRPCRVEVIDIWEMSRTVVCGEMTEKTKISLPGKEGMAVLVSAV